MKKLEKKLQALGIKGILTIGLLLGASKCSHGQANHDTLPETRYLSEIKYDTLPEYDILGNPESEYFYKTEVYSKKDKIFVRVTDISLREDKLKDKKEITEKCIKDVSAVNNKWDSLNNLSKYEKFNYFRKKYFEDFVPSETFNYDYGYWYFVVFKEKENFSDSLFQNCFYDFEKEKFVHSPVKKR